MDRRKTLGDVGVYLLLVFGISSLFYTLLINGSSLTGGGAAGRYVMCLMWSPALAALLTVWLRRIDIHSLGWGWGAWRWNAAGYLIPLCYVLAAYLLIWALGFGTFADPANVDPIAESMAGRA